MDDDVLEFLIADFSTRPLPSVVPRDVRVPLLRQKATTLVGMRRSGKTYSMFDVMHRLLAAGTPRERMLYVNLEDERLETPTVRTLDRALELFYKRDPRGREERSYLFFDEIQVVDGWERFIRRVLGTEDVQIVISGSSAKLLSTDIATALRGYALTVEVLPFSLREVMRARSTEPAPAPWPPNAQVRSRAAAALDSYLLIGGFSEVQEVHPFDRVQLLQGYVETVMLKDVVERHAVTNLTAMRHLVHALVAANAGIFSVSSLYGALISQGFKVSKQTLFDYLGHLTDAYLAFLVSLRSRSEKQRLVNARKVYLVDPGLAAAMYAGGAVNKGAQLETFVYLELRRRLGPLASGAVSYYRTRGGQEVDFAVDPVVPRDDSARPAELQLIQVCANLANPATREREVGALAVAMDEQGLSEGVMLTLSERETIEVPSGVVRVRPAWEWALETSQCA